MFDKFKTRKGRLENKLKAEMDSDFPQYDHVISIIDAYQKDNNDTIEKLKKEKRADMAKINGALKQTINAHGPITKELIGSAGKRIYGSLIMNPNQEEKKTTKISLRDFLIGVMGGVVVTVIILSLIL